MISDTDDDNVSYSDNDNNRGNDSDGINDNVSDDDNEIENDNDNVKRNINDNVNVSYSKILRTDHNLQPVFCHLLSFLHDSSQQTPADLHPAPDHGLIQVRCQSEPSNYFLSDVPGWLDTPCWLIG